MFRISIDKYRPHLDYTRFSLAPIRHILNHFLLFSGEGHVKGKLQQLVSTRLGKEDWHLQRTCSGCEFFDVCSHEARETKDLSLIGVSKHYKNFLNGILHKISSGDSSDGKNKVYDIEEAHAILTGYFSEQPVPYFSETTPGEPVASTATPVKGKGARSTPKRTTASKNTPSAEGTSFVQTQVSNFHSCLRSFCSGELRTTK